MRLNDNEQKNEISSVYFEGTCFQWSYDDEWITRHVKEAKKKSFF